MIAMTTSNSIRVKPRRRQRVIDGSCIVVILQK
jgi:hypothetical protein